MIKTARVGGNADQFPDILSLYLPSGAVADVTWGNGVFWKNVDLASYTLYKSDIRPEYGGIDLRATPYESESMDGWVIDLPYMHSPGSIKTSLARSYYNNQDVKMGVRELVDKYADGCKEAYRCLKPDGVVIVKCQDTVASGKQHLVHIDIFNAMRRLGFEIVDLFVMVQNREPTMDPKWGAQKHARKNHSYWLIGKKTRAGATWARSQSQAT